MSQIKIYTDQSEHYIDDMLFNMGSSTGMFVTSIALTVLKVTTPNGLDRDYFDPGLFAEGSRQSFFASTTYLGWAEHGHFNCWWSMVTFLHRVSETLVTSNGKRMIALDAEKVNVLCSALRSAKRWKEEFHIRERSLRGDDWGSATTFNKFDPAEHVPAVTKLYNLNP